MNSEHKTPQQCWLDIHAAAGELKGTTISSLFAADGHRAASMHAQGPGISLDYSKSLLNEKALSSLAALFDSAAVKQKLAGQFRGDHVNLTENRAALHPAVRAASLGFETPVGGNIRAEFRRTCAFALSLYSGHRKGATGESIRDVVNLGIGGSDLGPRMATNALASYCDGHTNVHFVSSLDDSELFDTLRHLDPTTTLFVISSKSFSTEETLTNARRAIKWFLEARPQQEFTDHFVAITANPKQAAALGIVEDLIFSIPDGIGGRYSIWSSCGLPLMIAIGPMAFEQFLLGAYHIDQHAAQNEFRENIAALMAAIEIWHRNCLGYSALAIIPYSYRLRQLPAYLQQLVMESNGKSVTQSGQGVSHASAPLIWGTAGTEGQHSYHQLLHQGTDIIPVDFILPLGKGGGSDDSQRKLASHCLAQSKALMEGRTQQQALEEMQTQGLAEEEAERLAPHRAMPGNRPSNTLILDGLQPSSLGALIALYEHKTFFTSTLWEINPFDQWGVEYGKQLSQAIQSALDGETSSFDASTNALIKLVTDSQTQQEQEPADE